MANPQGMGERECKYTREPESTCQCTYSVQRRQQDAARREEVREQIRQAWPALHN